MQMRHYSCVVGVLFLSFSACTEAPLPKIVDADLAVTNVNVVAMADDSIANDQSVFVLDGKIVEIGSSDQYFPGETTKIVDGTGKFLIPGLADMHVHIWADSELPLYTANGVTLVRNMWGDTNTLQMRARVEAGDLLGPRIVTAGQLVDGDPPVWGEMSGVATTDEEAHALMNEQQEDGYDFFKIYALLDLETFDAIAAYSRESGFPFGGHVPDAVPLEHALQSGIATIEHLTGWNTATRAEGSPFLLRSEANREQRLTNNSKVAEQLIAGELSYTEVFDELEIRRLAEIAATEDVWSVPTLVVGKRSMTSGRQAEAEFARPEMRYMSPITLRSWDPSSDFRLKDFSDDQIEVWQAYFEWDLNVVRILHESGAPLLAGTDPPNPFVVHGFAIHEELGFMVDAGLSPYEALATATRAPAEFLGEQDIAGTIAVGKIADLVLLESNPLRDIGATRLIAGVVTRGHWQPKAELDAILEAIAAGFEMPDDWFEGVKLLPGEDPITVYDMTFRGEPVGAVRSTVRDNIDGSQELTMQSRWPQGTDIVTETYEMIFDSEAELGKLDYVIDNSTSSSRIRVNVNAGTLNMTVTVDDNPESTQRRSLNEDEVLLAPYDAEMLGLVPYLDRMEVGNSIELDVVVIDTELMKFVDESWSVSRTDDKEDRQRSFAGTILRGSVESTFVLTQDAAGTLSLAVSNQFGVLEMRRRD